MEEEKEEVGKKEREQLAGIKVSKKAYELIVTLQGWRQARERKRVSVSEVLCDALSHEIERIGKIEK